MKEKWEGCGFNWKQYAFSLVIPMPIGCSNWNSNNSKMVKWHFVYMINSLNHLQLKMHLPIDWFLMCFWIVFNKKYSANLEFVFSCDQAALRMAISVCPSVRLWHLFDNVPIIVSSWNFQELLPMSKVMSMRKVKVRGQRSRSQRSWSHLAVSGP